MIARDEVERLAAGASEGDLAREVASALRDVESRLGSPVAERPETRSAARDLIARFGDDLRMLREARSGRAPSPPPAEGRPLQSRPDAPVAILARQVAALAEGLRMLMEEGQAGGTNPIPDAELGDLTHAQHLAAMLIRARALAGTLS
ncbi:MAG: hypothetical protein GEU28_02740 [Dehalococcoidia bacterium]|nr:hypothetical protein [Dehalococcoidia bacterium]